MDPSDLLRGLLRPRAVGEALAPGLRWIGVSSDVGLRLRVELAGEPLWIDVQPLAEARRYAARSRRLAFTYRTEGGRRELDGRAARSACEAIAALASANEDALLGALRADAVDRPPGRVRRVTVSQALEPAGDADDPFYTLSPYVGCTIGCGYCYAHRQLVPLRRLLGLPEAPWGSYVDVRHNLPEILADELRRLPPAPIKLCPIVSDPYQAIETRERLTRRVLDALAAADAIWPTLVLTRSLLILEDIDRLRALPRAFAGVSLPTVDDAIRQRFEPRAASVAERLTILRRLREAGIPTHVVVQPILPGSQGVLVDHLAELADSVSIDVLRGEGEASAAFAAPEIAACRDDAWQLERAMALRDRLVQRGVAVWPGELPPSLLAGR